MKLSSCFKLSSIGVLAVSAAIAMQHPSTAKPKVTVTTTGNPNATVTTNVPPGSTVTTTTTGTASTTAGVTVVPTVPSAPAPGAPAPAGPAPGAPAPGGMVCVPGAPGAPGAVPCGPAPQPMARDSFFCGAGPQGIPTTFVNTPNGNLPIIRWVSYHFNESGYPPQVRCRDVTQRFNTFYNQGILNFITTGFVNNLPVICVAGRMGGPCTNVLFTLKPNQNATQTIQQLFDVRAGASGPLLESENRIYVDMRPYTNAIQANR